MKIFFQLIILLSCFIIWGRASATNLTLSISPVSYKIILNHGQKSNQTVTIKNISNEKVNVKTQLEDFDKLSEEGVPSFKPKVSGKSSLANWITTDQEIFFLNSLEEKKVSFSISVPNDVTPGGYYAGIFFKGQNPDLHDLSLNTRIGSLIMVNISGETLTQTGKIEEFKVPTFLNKGPVSFSVRYKNTGNIDYQPKGKIKIYDSKGLINEIVLPKHTVLPDNIRQFDQNWQVGYKIGSYRAVAEIIDGDGNILSQEQKFILFPWKITLLIFGWILVIIFGFKIWKSK